MTPRPPSFQSSPGRKAGRYEARRAEEARRLCRSPSPFAECAHGPVMSHRPCPICGAGPGSRRPAAGRVRRAAREILQPRERGASVASAARPLRSRTDILPEAVSPRGRPEPPARGHADPAAPCPFPCRQAAEPDTPANAPQEASAAASRGAAIRGSRRGRAPVAADYRSPGPRALGGRVPAGQRLAEAGVRRRHSARPGRAPSPRRAPPPAYRRPRPRTRPRPPRRSRSTASRAPRAAACPRRAPAAPPAVRAAPGVRVRRSVELREAEGAHRAAAAAGSAGA